MTLGIKKLFQNLNAQGHSISGASLLSPAGLTGATQASRYVGATASVPPTTGTFAVGDWVVIQSGGIAVCTSAGTPGTWVTIGGYSPGGTDVAVADGGTGASTAADARTNLGLGSIATQASSAVTVTGGSVTGITDLAVADGGTGSSTAVAARSALGLVIGTDVMPTANPYMFRTYRSAGLNTANGAWTAIAYDAENYDSHNDVASGVFTAPLTGYYFFTATAVAANTAGELVAIALYKNGTAIAIGGEGTGAGLGVTVTDFVLLSSGNTVDVRFYCATTRAFNVGTAANWFAGHFVSL